MPVGVSCRGGSACGGGGNNGGRFYVISLRGVCLPFGARSVPTSFEECGSRLAAANACSATQPLLGQFALPGGFFKPFHVQNVLVTASGFLVTNEIVSRQHAYHLVSKGNRQPS